MTPINERLTNLVSLGVGGMGSVFRARDTLLQRDVAVKVIRPDVLGDRAEKATARFQREAEVMARVRHPAVVGIHDAGISPRGEPYLIMELVEGESLRARLEGGPLAVEAVTRWGQQVAEGLYACHQAGVVHRDVKPANIIIGADGQARLTDFGIALDGDARTRLTQTRAAVGTLTFMPPEQIAGQRVDGRSDVYGLGATLYELLTGRSLFDATNMVELMRSIVSDPPRPPRELRAEVGADLEAVVLTCLQKQPDDRYADAGALAEDLGRVLAGEAVQANPAPAPGPTARWVGERRGLLRVVAWGGVLLVAALSLGSAWLARLRSQAELRAEEARAERAPPERAIPEEPDAPTPSLPEGVPRGIERVHRFSGGDRGHGEFIGTQHLVWRPSYGDPLQVFALDDLSRPRAVLPRLKISAEVALDDGVLVALVGVLVRFDLDGVERERIELPEADTHVGQLDRSWSTPVRLAVATHRDFVWVYELRSTGPVQVLELREKKASLVASLSPAGDWMVVAAPDGNGLPRRRLKVFSVPDGELLAEKDILLPPERIRCSPDGETFAVATGEGNSLGQVFLFSKNDLRVLELSNPEDPRFPLAHREAARGLAFTPRGAHLFSASGGDETGEVRLWASPGGEALELQGGELNYGARDLSISPDGRWLLVGTSAARVDLFSVDYGDE